MSMYIDLDIDVTAILVYPHGCGLHSLASLDAQFEGETAGRHSIMSSENNTMGGA